MFGRVGRLDYLTSVIILTSASIALSLAVERAWSSTIQVFLQMAWPRDSAIVGFFIHAIVLTVAAVIVIVKLGAMCKHTRY